MLEDVPEIVGVNWERVALSREYGNTEDRECQCLGSIFPRNVKVQDRMQRLLVVVIIVDSPFRATALEPCLAAIPLLPSYFCRGPVPTVGAPQECEGADDPRGPSAVAEERERERDLYIYIYIHMYITYLCV